MKERPRNVDDRELESPPIATMTALHQRLYAIVQDLAPELGMKRPGAMGEGSTFVVFQPVGLRLRRRNLEFRYEMQEGCVDLELCGVGPHRAEFMREHGGDVPDWIEPTVIEEGDTLALRVETEPLCFAPGDPEEAARMRMAVERAAGLLHWAQDHSDVIEFQPAGSERRAKAARDDGLTFF